MEGLIIQAFTHIEGIGPHVMEGHYDLEGPEGELILKEIWSSTIQPGWQITMKMWPAESHPLRREQQQRQRMHHNMHIPSNMDGRQREQFIQAAMQANHLRAQMGGGGGGQPMGRPPMQGVGGGNPMGRPPPGFPGPFANRPAPGMPPVVLKEKKKGHAKKPSGWGGLLGMSSTKKSSSKKYDRPSLLFLLCCC